MSANELHVGDIGTTIRLTISDENNAIVDVSSATVKKIIFSKSNGSVVVKDALFTTDGTNGQIEYTTVSTDIDIAGMWKIQGYVQLGSGTWYTDISNKNVYSNLTTI